MRFLAHASTARIFIHSIFCNLRQSGRTSNKIYLSKIASLWPRTSLSPLLRSALRGILRAVHAKVFLSRRHARTHVHMHVSAILLAQSGTERRDEAELSGKICALSRSAHDSAIETPLPDANVLFAPKSSILIISGLLGTLHCDAWLTLWGALIFSEQNRKK